MPMRGIRGATTVETDTPEEIWAVTQEMGREILDKNHLLPENIGAIILSATGDLTSAFPATGIRKLPGFDLVPLFDAQQLNVDNSLSRCIRMLVLAETDLSQAQIRHVYLRGAKKLRPDLAKEREE